MSEQSSNLVSIEWLNQNLNNLDLVILDATMKKKPNGEPIRVPSVVIPGAQMFNFDTEICDQNTELPHMLCSADEFQQAARKLGINNNSTIVVYDAMGIFSSPRAWWMFKVMGHNKVFVLDGGLPKWIDGEYLTETKYRTLESGGDFFARFNPAQVFSSQQVLTHLENDDIQILDARSHARFKAEEPEPRQELKGGHIPGSTCLPFTELLSDGYFKKIDELKKAFELSIGANTKQLVFSCGSGVTACILALGAEESGITNTTVYDGSWSEWAASDSLPIEI